MSGADELAARIGARRVGQEWRTTCPLHADEHPSLDFRAGDHGLVYTCRSAGCESGAISAHFRAAHPDLLGNGNGRAHDADRQEWRILDGEGRTVAVHGRYRGPDGSKRYAWALPDGTHGLGGRRAAGLPLYRLPELLAAKCAADGDEAPLVVLCEGEKAADAASRLGFVAVGTVTGAAGVPSDDSLRPLLGCRVVLWPDADAPGRLHMQRIAARLTGLGGEVAGLVVATDAPAGADAADFRGSKDDALALVRPTLEAEPKVEAPAVEPLPSVRVAEVASKPVLWAWSRRSPFGKVTIVDGDPGLGKSGVIGALTGRWTRGESLPGEDVGREPFNVLLLSAEDGVADTLRPRLEAAGADLSRVFVIEGLPIFPADLPRLAATVRATAARVVVLDPGLAYLDPELDSHADAEARRMIAGLAALAEETGAAIIFIRHLNKAAGANALYRGGGSIAFIATARSALLIAPDPNDPSRRVLACTKSNLCAAPPSLLFRVVADGPEGPPRIVWEGETTVSAAEALAAVGDKRRADATEARSDAIDLLRDLLAEGPVPAAEVAKALSGAGIGGKEPLKVYAVKLARRALGIRSVKTGWAEWSWTLPEGGRR